MFLRGGTIISNKAYQFVQVGRGPLVTYKGTEDHQIHNTYRKVHILPVWPALCPPGVPNSILTAKKCLAATRNEKDKVDAAVVKELWP